MICATSRCGRWRFFVAFAGFSKTFARGGVNEPMSDHLRTGLNQIYEGGQSTFVGCGSPPFPLFGQPL